MHPRDSASRETRHRRPTKTSPVKTMAKGPGGGNTADPFLPPTDRLENMPSTSSASAPFLGGMQMRNYIALRGYLGYSLTNGSAATAPHTVQKTGPVLSLSRVVSLSNDWGAPHPADTGNI